MAQLPPEVAFQLPTQSEPHQQPSAQGQDPLQAAVVEPLELIELDSRPPRPQGVTLAGGEGGTPTTGTAPPRHRPSRKPQRVQRLPVLVPQLSAADAAASEGTAVQHAGAASERLDEPHPAAKRPRLPPSPPAEPSGSEQLSAGQSAQEWSERAAGDSAAAQPGSESEEEEGAGEAEDGGLGAAALCALADAAGLCLATKEEDGQEGPGGGEELPAGRSGRRRRKPQQWDAYDMGDAEALAGDEQWHPPHRARQPAAAAEAAAEAAAAAAATAAGGGGLGRRRPATAAALAVAAGPGQPVRYRHGVSLVSPIRPTKSWRATLYLALDAQGQPDTHAVPKAITLCYANTDSEAAAARDLGWIWRQLHTPEVAFKHTLLNLGAQIYERHSQLLEHLQQAASLPELRALITRWRDEGWLLRLANEAESAGAAARPQPVPQAANTAGGTPRTELQTILRRYLQPRQAAAPDSSAAPPRQAGQAPAAAQRGQPEEQRSEVKQEQGESPGAAAAAPPPAAAASGTGAAAGRARAGRAASGSGAGRGSSGGGAARDASGAAAGWDADAGPADAGWPVRYLGPVRDGKVRGRPWRSLVSLALDAAGHPSAASKTKTLGVGYYCSRKVAALARDLALVWRFARLGGDGAIAATRFNASYRSYQQQPGLVAALKGAPTLEDLRTLLSRWREDGRLAALAEQLLPGPPAAAVAAAAAPASSGAAEGAARGGEQAQQHGEALEPSGAGSPREAREGPGAAASAEAQQHSQQQQQQQRAPRRHEQAATGAAEQPLRLVTGRRKRAASTAGLAGERGEPGPLPLPHWGQRKSRYKGGPQEHGLCTSSSLSQGASAAEEQPQRPGHCSQGAELAPVAARGGPAEEAPSGAREPQQEQPAAAQRHAAAAVAAPGAVVPAVDMESDEAGPPATAGLAPQLPAESHERGPAPAGPQQQEEEGQPPAQHSGALAGGKGGQPAVPPPRQRQRRARLGSSGTGLQRSLVELHGAEDAGPHAPFSGVGVAGPPPRPAAAPTAQPPPLQGASGRTYAASAAGPAGLGTGGGWAGPRVRTRQARGGGAGGGT